MESMFAENDITYAPADEFFQNVVKLLRNMLGVESATISVTDGQQRWLKASSGLDYDDIYTDVKFYAGVPILSVDDEIIGTLSALDSEERTLSPGQLQALEGVARVVTDFYELRRLAVSDGLTGLLTRRAFEEEAERLAQLCTRHRHPLNMICLDVDHFKSINDTYGHAAGDKVLRAVSETCRSHLRQSDVFGRMGGEEFAILLPQTDEDGAILVAEKLRVAIGAMRFEFGGKTVRVTASFGVASQKDRQYDVATLLGRADAAMYQAKQTGRNRSVIWGDETDRVERVVRRRVLKAGQIAFAGTHASIDCTVRSLGQEGAGLDLVTTTNVPDEFRLLIRSDKLSVSCKVTARTRTHLEVEFR
ncbi:GGDEF domain-containing protein [Henriciella aquimarina]|uniref:GGDEF domain-containing protein n=1 Tax=Henriciella aquimarina TaxID=545261 RepID=UPI000A0788AF|nr:GGDEF domain-containing protein [Henriciella aquimarina]